MSDPGFVHLRVHSEYSIVDSIVRIGALVKAARADAQPAIALTDLGNMFGWVKMYTAARGAGLKPICGCDAWLANELDRDNPFRVLLLARNHAGYLRLCDLLSRAWIDNEHRGRGEMRREWFADERDLIALSGAHHGDVGQALLMDQSGNARALASDWTQRFCGNYYVELQRSGHPDAENHVRLATAMAAELGLPVVATHPVQFLAPDEFDAHEARVCIAEGDILANPRRVRRFFADQYLKPRAEMARLFADLPEALANSVEIARRCNLSLELGKARLPDFPTPKGMSLDAFLRAEACRGLQARLETLFPDPNQRERAREAYQRRLEYECDTIVQMGFPGYFLIVADFINWAKRNGVPVGPGRGSGAGSLVAFALGITDLDPIPYALLFERFLNPERVSMPDFDIDFCQDNRYKVIEYVRKRYGTQAVAQIVTFGTMASKAVIRDAGRVLDLPYNFCDQLSKLIPVYQNKPLSLAKAREAEPMLVERERDEDEVRALLALAGPLEDLVRNVGMHAGGVLIAPGKLTDFCPLYKAPGTESVISQYDKDDVESVGLVKFDFLGLRNLTIIDLAVQYVNRRHPELALDLSRLSFDDAAAYEVLRQANTTAIFQVESEGMKKLLKKLQPDRFEDIIAVLALYRPGPLGSGMVDDFILRKKGQQRIDYFHPDLKPCLEPTYGVIVYQEQVMQIAQIVGGYTLGSADLLRRAIGKKNPSEMAKHRDVFIDGARGKGYTVELATQLFDLMAKFAEYGFNKSHTAAYAVVTYQTAWLKAHHPAEFMAATASSDMDDTDKVQLSVKDARANGVAVLGPDINASGYRFEPVEERAIRYGLGAVKGAGENAVLNILKARQEGPFENLFDFCERVDRRTVNRRAIESLIRAGAFDALESNRAMLLASLANAIESAEQRAAAAGQVSLFGGDGGEHDAACHWVAAEPWPERKRLQQEKTALGYYFSGHLFTGYEREARRIVRTALAELQPQREPQWMAGVVAGVRTQMTRRGKMVILTLDDASATLEVSVYNELYGQVRNLAREDALVFVFGRISHDEYTGGQRVVADRVIGLAEARVEFARALRIRLNGIAETRLLREAIGPFSVDPASAAGLRVVVQYANSEASCAVELGEAWRVRPDDELLDTVESLLHPQEVDVDY